MNSDVYFFVWGDCPAFLYYYNDLDSMVSKMTNFIYLHVANPEGGSTDLFIRVSTINDIVQGDGETIIRTETGQYVVMEPAKDVMQAIEALELTGVNYETFLRAFAAKL